MDLSTQPNGQLLLIAGAAILYCAGRAAAGALAAWTRVPGYCLPIAATAIAAVFLGQPDVAVAVILATSVASLSLIAGCMAMLRTGDQEPISWPTPTRAAAGLMLPVALLTLLAGFSGRLGWINIAVLAVEGAALALLRTERDMQPVVQNTRALRPVLLLAAVAFSVIGAVFAVNGSVHVGLNLDYPAAPVVISVALSPLLVSPMLLSGANLVQSGQAWAAAGEQIGLAQLNLCGLLPATALLWHLRTQTPLIFPLANWRVEGVALVVLAAAQLPAVAGRWRPGKIEGTILICIYAGFVLAVLAAAVPS